MKIRGHYYLWILGIILFPVTSIPAQVRLPALFTDHMVLQQGDNVAIWGWAHPGENVIVTPSWPLGEPAGAVAGEDGKWLLYVKTPSAGGPYTLSVKASNEITLNDVLIGEVWICSGQSNMEMALMWCENAETETAQADFPRIRMITVPHNAARTPQDDFSGQWRICTPEIAKDFSAAAYNFARNLHQHTLEGRSDIPIGLIGTYWGGTMAEAWTRHEVLESNPAFASILQAQKDHEQNMPQLLVQYEEALKQWEIQAAKAKEEGTNPPWKPEKPLPFHQNSPSALYNGMLAPLIPYAFRGVIWYQGESNFGRGIQYRSLFPAMVANWRDNWGRGEFPFYYVQIAPHPYHTWWDALTNFPADPQFEQIRQAGPRGVGIAEVQEAQRLSLDVPNTGMAVTTDIVHDLEDIHPRNKLDVGKRLALWARAKTYGEKNLVYSGPLYDHMIIECGKVRIYFTHTGSGLVARDGELKEFTLAGQDRVFYPASAVIEGDTIVVSSPDVPNPLSVRFAFRNAPEPNLFNAEGLPASPFRSDEWPAETCKLAP
ncbi:MAG: hypothetical protein JW709_09175 [Sedimentisphaerales bacterium]|nr:hypothetical protein [Sedimentisphaerales bacterium]